jgi:hypothetical protein
MDESDSKRTAPDPHFNADVREIVSRRAVAKEY